ncbi:MAG: 16S rRNA (adenine(1518)-N(6)/adenine(1519)-N(6))-dimethyltransferase RsmA [Candidatus Hydrogenedentes bacterium]|nr:16S rRNA (adenine(1518)-N(6)/adenine(1519)-N(6))-dimethyltransferase RsmA [Candidatus Hydrogenedentota bacterium]
METKKPSVSPNSIINPGEESVQVLSSKLPKPKLKELLKKYNIRLKKRLGQNLLLDDNINRIMVECANLTPDDYVIEVGAGLGSLTWHIVQYVGMLLAIEIDPSFIPCLQDRFGHLPNIRIFRGDILNHELEELVSEFLPNGKRYKMLSNLPYYITTPILFHFLESPIKFERIVVMVQHEVAQRMCATPDSKDYGVLSLAVQSLCNVDIVHFVPRTCFVPKPDVDSCIVRLRKIEPPIIDLAKRKKIINVIKVVFSHRRKTLKNALGNSPQLKIGVKLASEALRLSGIDPQLRPEKLSWDDFVRLTDNIERLKKETLKE